MVETGGGIVAVDVAGSDGGFVGSAVVVEGGLTPLPLKKTVLCLTARHKACSDKYVNKACPVSL